MFRAFSRPSSGVRWLQWQILVLPSYRDDSRPARPRTQHDYHHDTKVKPEAATAVIELLMIGGKTPETCWAVNKRQDNKLENCCIWLVIYLKWFSVFMCPTLLYSREVIDVYWGIFYVLQYWLLTGVINEQRTTYSVYRTSQHGNVASVLYAVGRRFVSWLKKRISRTGLSSALEMHLHKSRKSSVSFVMSVHLSAWSSAAPTGRIFVKFDIGKFVERHQIWLKSDKVWHTLRDDVSYVYIFHSITEYFVARQLCKGNRFFHFLDTSEHFCVVDSCI